MTAKHFKVIAFIVKSITDTAERKRIAGEFAAMCKADNKNFDRDKFLEACGVST